MLNSSASLTFNLSAASLIRMDLLSGLELNFSQAFLRLFNFLIFFCIHLNVTVYIENESHLYTVNIQ